MSDDDDGYDSNSVEEAIFTCIIARDTAQLRNILGRGVHLDFCNRYGEGPLHIAVSQGVSDGKQTAEKSFYYIQLSKYM